MSYFVFHVQCRAIELALALAEREYLRYPPGTIIDGVNVGGQFATGKKSGSAPQKEVAIPSKSLMGDVTKALEKTIAQSKDLDAKISRTVAEISKSIVAQYPIDQKPLQLPGASFAQKLQVAAAQYLSAEARLPIASPPEQKKLLGDMIKAAVPLAVALGLTVGVEVAIGMLIGQTIGEAIVGSALVLGVSSATDKALDIAKVENPIVRASLQIVAGLATGGLVAKSIKATAMETGRIAEVAKQFVEQATATPGVLSKIGDVRKLVTVLEKEQIDSGKVLDALRREVTQDNRLKRTGAPHSFSERLKKYVDLSMGCDKNKGAIGLECRKGIIDAELKYGEHLDLIHQISPAQVFSPSARTQKTYQNFLKSIATGKKNQTKTQAVDRAFAKERLLGDGNFVLNGTKAINKYPIDMGSRIVEVQQEVGNASSLSNTKLHDIFVGYFEPKRQKGVYRNDGSRGYAIQLQRGTETINYIQVGLFGRTRELAFHETGHFIEDANKMAQTSVDYILSRKTKGKPALIDNREVVKTDFLNPYTGKTYGELGREDATEVVSMGLQSLADIFGTQRAVREDIDHLRYTLFALDTTN